MDYLDQTIRTLLDNLISEGMAHQFVECTVPQDAGEELKILVGVMREPRTLEQQISLALHVRGCLRAWDYVSTEAWQVVENLGGKQIDVRRE